MSDKNIYHINGSYKIEKTINGRHHIFGTYNSKEDAVIVRDLLIEKNWDLVDISEIHKHDDDYYILKVIDNRLHLLAKYKKAPSSEQIDRLVKKQIRNPNNSRYGLNISNVFGVYIIKKQIAGDDYIFGYYDLLEDATFSRNHLLEHEWDVNSFNKVEFDDETRMFKSIKVIDDKVCILGTFSSKKEALDNYENSLNEFISKIYKNKHGLARYPHLDAFVDVEFDEGVRDENWDLNKLGNVSAQDLIFNLTPWQKIIHDNIKTKTFTFDELLLWLKMYRTKNFEKKVKRYLDELIDMGIIKDIGDKKYEKVK